MKPRIILFLESVIQLVEFGFIATIIVIIPYKFNPISDAIKGQGSIIEDCTFKSFACADKDTIEVVAISLGLCKWNLVLVPKFHCSKEALTVVGFVVLQEVRIH